MLHGLMWLPLLAIFIGLTWAGWNEYQKVEAYRTWAETCDRAKYDVRAMLGQRGRQLIWGKPTRQGLTSQQSVSLDQVSALQVRMGNELIEDAASSGKPAALELCLADGTMRSVPFTNADMALQWRQALERDLPPDPQAIAQSGAQSGVQSSAQINAQ
ncbi:MAG: hypothetical protein ACFB5Z_05835 [Elainellaceae cyanobacterium]